LGIPDFPCQHPDQTGKGNPNKHIGILNLQVLHLKSLIGGIINNLFIFSETRHDQEYSINNIEPTQEWLRDGHDLVQRLFGSL
jgi:hypothetical protein